MRRGRRGALQTLAVFYVVSALGSAATWAWTPLLVFRVIGGLAIGGSSVLGPMYITEISPAHLRGRMVGMFQFNMVLGILVAYLSNYLVGLAGFGPSEWRWKLGVAAAPAVFFLLMMLSIPQSPRWLASKGRTAEAENVLGLIGEANPKLALKDITDGIRREQQQKTQKLSSRQYRLPVFLAISIGVVNQITGINVKKTGYLKGDCVRFFENKVSKCKRGGQGRNCTALQSLVCAHRWSVPLSQTKACCLKRGQIQCLGPRTGI